MDIKGLGRPLIGQTDVRKTKETTRDNIKSESSTDREGNGRQQHGEPERRKLTDEEMKAAVEHLSDLPGVKSNNLHIVVETHNDMRIVLVKEPSGKIVRRIPEMDLLDLTRDRKKNKGQLLDRVG
jgi:uncharacterized FlaG/YvyC family protein